MKTILLLLLTLALAGTASHGLAQSVTPSQRTSPCVEGELLVKFAGGPWSEAAVECKLLMGHTVHRDFPEWGWQHVRLPAGMSVSQALAAYRVLPGVLAVEANSFHRAADAPNDPQFGAQYGLAKIGATNAWAVTTGSTNVVVAVIDSGINYNHEDLRANMWRNPSEILGNGIDDDGNGYVDDVYGIDTASHDSDPFDEGAATVYHGSRCAGIIGAASNNGKGIAGVNWSIQLMAIRVNTTSDLIRTSALLEGYEYVAMMKRRGINIRVTNNSIYSAAYSQAHKDALDALGDLGILNVVVAGNDAIDNDVFTEYPSCYDSPSVISVASTDSSDRLADSSEFGRTTVDLAAPGVDIISTDGSSTNSYSVRSGTSYACPHVVGAAALLWAADPTLTVDGVKAALFGSVDVLPILTNKTATGGRLNVGRAMQNLFNTNLPPIVVTALPSFIRAPSATRLTVTFSRPMDRASVEAAFQLSPAASGMFVWTNDDRTVVFIPSEPLLALTNYTATIRGTAQDTEGRTLDGNFNRVSQRAPADNFSWNLKNPPPNDELVFAQTLSGPAGQVLGVNRNATLEFREPDKGGNSGGASVWYRWATTTNGWVTFDTKGTAFDTLLAVRAWNGEAPRLYNVMNLVASDDFGRDKTSRVAFFATNGIDYYIGADGKSVPGINNGLVAQGEFALNWYPTPPVTIVLPPVNTLAVVSNTATFRVTAISEIATGAIARLSYQWRFNGTDLAHATNSSLSISNVTPANEGSYTVEASNTLGSVTSEPATLRVVFRAVIVAQPQSQIVVVGDDATFSVSVTGTEPFAFRLRRASTTVMNVVLSTTNCVFTLSNVQTNQAGNYTVVVTNLAGSVLSAVATLTVLPAPPAPPRLTAFNDAGMVTLILEGQRGVSYRIEQSTHLPEWKGANLTVTPTNGTGAVSFPAPGTPGSGSLFYRAIVLP